MYVFVPAAWKARTSAAFCPAAPAPEPRAVRLAAPAVNPVAEPVSAAAAYTCAELFLI